MSDVNPKLLGDSCFNSRRWWKGKQHRGVRAYVHAATSSSRYGKLPGGVTYAADFKHSELHLCAHGQRQALCVRCGARFCGCPGSLMHQCSEAA